MNSCNTIVAHAFLPASVRHSDLTARAVPRPGPTCAATQSDAARERSTKIQPAAAWKLRPWLHGGSTFLQHRLSAQLCTVRCDALAEREPETARN